MSREVTFEGLREVEMVKLGRLSVDELSFKNLLSVLHPVGSDDPQKMTAHDRHRRLGESFTESTMRTMVFVGNRSFASCQ